MKGILIGTFLAGVVALGCTSSNPLQETTDGEPDGVDGADVEEGGGDEATSETGDEAGGDEGVEESEASDVEDVPEATPCTLDEECDDGLDCSTDSCDTGAGVCVFASPDEDGDTVGDAACTGMDCDDTDPAIHPGALEACDGVDNDCDGTTDGGLLPSGSDCTAHTECCSGSCVSGTCTVGYGLCEPPGATCVTPAECCSGRCERTPAGTSECFGSGSCAAVGESCVFSADCCGLSCVDGTCTDGEACDVTGASCSTAFDCCSGLCGGTTCDSIGGTCSPIGEACSAGGNCCSAVCEAGRCALSFFCRASGEICDEGADCCNGICDGVTATAPGRCAFLGACQTVGQPCTGNRSCCSRACVDPGVGIRVCTYLSGCRPMGEVCETAGDCCSGLCEPDDGGLSMRCQNPPGCQPAGEMCIAGATNNCCGGHAYCLPTIAGVFRCWSPDWTECIPEGELCHFGDECCSGVCTPWPDGTFRCGETCVPEGGVCTTDADCCLGSCIDGICGPPEVPCVPLGGTCTDHSDCCSGYCLDGTCVPPSV